MQITLTGTMYLYGIAYDSSNEMYPYSSTSAIGYSNSGIYKGMNYMFCYPGKGDAFNEKYRNAIKNPTVTLKVNLTYDGSQGLGDSSFKDLEIRTYSQDYFEDASSPSGMSYEALWDYVSYHYATKKTHSPSGSFAALSFTITDKTEINNIFGKGISLYPAEKGGTATTSGYRNFYKKVNSVSVEITGETTEAAPVVSLNTSAFAGQFVDGTYFHPAGDTPFAVGVNYSQSIGVGMSALHYTAKDAMENVLTSGTTSATSFTFDRELWKDLPASGTLEVSATSAHGLPSATLVIPWVITHKNLSVLSPVSGSIIPTGQNVELRWDLILPEGMPSAPDPTGYTVWPVWDGGEEYQTGYKVTEREFVIPAEELAGHTALKLLITDEYGDGTVSRRKGDGKLVLLYLQPSAAIHAVSLETEYETGLYTPLLTAVWDSAGQAAFQVLADTFDSGVIWGKANRYVIPKIFSDGAHAVQVRIQDANGSWGDWTEPVFAMVKNRGNGGSVNLSAKAVDVGVELNITGSPAHADVLIYRNEKLIAQLEGTADMKFTYTDKDASGECRYAVRFVSENGFYSVSPTVFVNATPATDGMVLEDGTWLPLLYAVEHPTVYKATKTEETYAKHYAGRSYPVIMRSGRKSRTLTMEYIDKDASLCDVLEEICGSVVTYKNVLGEVLKAEINNVSAGRSAAWNTVSFRLTQCDEPGEVIYDLG